MTFRRCPRVIAIAVVRGYAETGHPVILHGSSSRPEHEQLVTALSSSGLTPVRLVELTEREDDGDVVRRLLDGD